MIYHCVCIMIFHWNIISIPNMGLWHINIVNGPLLVFLILSLLTVPPIISLLLPVWWGKLPLHNIEKFLSPFVYIFCHQVVGYVCCSHWLPTDFSHIIWYLTSMLCMFGSYCIFCWYSYMVHCTHTGIDRLTCLFL